MAQPSARRAPERSGTEIRAAAPSADALVVTPWLYIYDFSVLAILLALLARIGLREGLLPRELAGIALACGLVVAFLALAMPSGSAALAVVGALIARRDIAAR